MTRIAILLIVLAPLARGDEETALFFVSKARNALGQEDYGKAEQWLQRALKEEKNYAPALLALAEVAQAQGNRAQAITYLEACVARDGGNLSGSEKKAVGKARARLKKLDVGHFLFFNDPKYFIPIRLRASVSEHDLPKRLSRIPN